jgi:hypothetical protein
MRERENVREKKYNLCEHSWELNIVRGAEDERKRDDECTVNK